MRKAPIIRITQATGKATCKYCDETIVEGLTEVVGNLGTGKFDGHYHLRPTEKCEGFITKEYNFIYMLVACLTEAEIADLSEALGGQVNFWMQEPDAIQVE